MLKLQNVCPSCIRVLSRFFDPVGQETTYAFSGYIFSLNNVTVRPTKIMNRGTKNWANFWKKKFLQKSKFSKKNFLSKAGFLVQYSSKKKQDRMYSDPKARNG